MPLYGKIVVIKRNGEDGAHFPLVQAACHFGRSNDCDIRIQLPMVSKEHARIDVTEQKQVISSSVFLISFTGWFMCVISG